MSEDYQLIYRFKKGDHEAFRSLFEKYYSGLLGFATHLVQDRELARELVQDTYLAAWEKRKNLHPGSFKSYLFTVLNNKALNHIRHQKIIRAAEHEIIQSQTPVSTEETEVRPYLKQAIEAAIEALPSKARQCFTLTQVDGLSVREAAGKMGVSVKTVENQLLRSRKILRKKLKTYLD